jgi:hypothetical protein
VATLKTSLFNLTETLINTVRVYKQQGAVIAETTKQATRIDLCVSCPNLTDNGVCKMCGCIMNLKVRLEAAKCPANKW